MLTDEQRAALAPYVEPKMTPYVAEMPTPRQAAFLTLDSLEAFYGGAMGGGKSSALLMAALQYVDCPGYAALILRRHFVDLGKPGAIMQRAEEWLGATDASWNGNDRQWRFPSGATLTFGYAESVKDTEQYMSTEFQFIGMDEMTQFPERVYQRLMTRLRRRVGMEHIPLRMRGGSNPGGEGHDWVLQRFLIEGRSRGRVFVPAKLEDNPHVDRVSYERALAELNELDRARYRHGDWTVRDDSNKVCPEWTPERAETSLEPIQRPEYFTAYIVADLAEARDLCVFLFAYWHFEAGKVVVEDELVMKKPSDEDYQRVGDVAFALWGDSLAAGKAEIRGWWDNPVTLTLRHDRSGRKIIFGRVPKDDAAHHRNAARASIQRDEWRISPRAEVLRKTLELGSWNEKQTDFARTEALGHCDAWAAAYYLNRMVVRTYNPTPNEAYRREAVVQALKGEPVSHPRAKQLETFFDRRARLAPKGGQSGGSSGRF